MLRTKVVRNMLRNNVQDSRWHRIDISIMSLTTPGVFLGTYSAGPGPTRRKAALLMREDARHGVYDSRADNRFLGLSSGHVWIHRTRSTPRPLGPGNGRRPILDRP